MRASRPSTAHPSPSRNVLTCTRCGESVDFDADIFSTLDEALTRLPGYELASHRLELFGCCAACRALGVPAGAAWGRA